uniref:Putative ovule protein n=1 Tax=Solanum chacoense TaxID=4108 RepID=A0A0V0H4C1_SOLCH
MLQNEFCNTPYARTTKIQFSRSCYCKPQSTLTDRRVTHRPCWWSLDATCNPSSVESRKSSRG